MLCAELIVIAVLNGTQDDSFAVRILWPGVVYFCDLSIQNVSFMLHSGYLHLCVKMNKSINLLYLMNLFKFLASVALNKQNG